ncbi:MAG: DNA polymerase III subunit delta' [Desulfovibrio sp.]|nr:DNA polymerase III subunit delta' [Desulfovibrio sp.]
MDALLPAIAGSRQATALETLDRLGSNPPQVLLLEGGTEAERMDAARYWACRLNCPQAAPSPCLHCPVCRQIACGEYLDWAAYDGRISNREDEDNPGSVRAFNMANVRELKARLRDALHGDGRRVVLLMGLGLAREEAANALLKALEEPSPTTVFVLLAPQREQLLPTLISRSFCLTLPWPDSRREDVGIREWEDMLAKFVLDGTGFLDKTALKGSVDQDVASRLLLSCSRTLCRLIAGQNVNALDAALNPLDAMGKLNASRWLEEAHEALLYGVTPARVLQAFAMRLFVLRRQSPTAQRSAKITAPRP